MFKFWKICLFRSGFQVEFENTKFLQRLGNSKGMSIMGINTLAKTIQIQPLTRQNYLEASRVLATSFCCVEPATKHLGVTIEEAMPLSAFVCQQAAGDTVSIVAKLAGKTVGCFIMERPDRPFAFTHFYKNEKLKAFFSILACLKLDISSLTKNKMIHPIFLGVNVPFQGYRMAERLFFNGMERARTQGYKNFFMEARGPYTLNLLRHYCPDIQRLNSIRYSDFLSEKGEKIFESLQGEIVLGKASTQFSKARKTAELTQPFIIRKPFSDKEWEMYHQIKKVNIFDPIGISYDSNHPSIHNKNHHHFVFLNQNEIVGVIHIQQIENQVCAIRSIAIKGSLKNQGLGTILLELAEKQIKNFMCETVHLHANPRSYSFYKNSGYIEMPFPNDTSIYPKAIDMMKKLRKRNPLKIKP